MLGDLAGSGVAAENSLAGADLDHSWRCPGCVIILVWVCRGLAPAWLTLVFCEVKCRSGLGSGHPLEAITYTKMRMLRRLAVVWTPNSA